MFYKAAKLEAYHWVYQIILYHPHILLDKCQFHIPIDCGFISYNVRIIPNNSLHNCTYHISKQYHCAYQVSN